MPADVGRKVMGFLFHCKDEGSAQTLYQRSAFQGFSVRAGGQVPLPATVSALRCQRGPHEPDGDHLFDRDRIAKGTTLESLGFSAEEAAVFSEIRMSLRDGIFLGGTAGDGKSTTLATNLALQMDEARGQLNVVTIEEPARRVRVFVSPDAIPAAIQDDDMIEFQPPGAIAGQQQKPALSPAYFAPPFGQPFDNMVPRPEWMRRRHRRRHWQQPRRPGSSAPSAG